MDRWKAEQGRGREKRKIRKKKSKKKEDAEKVGKSRNTVFFQWFMAPEGRNVGSLKRRVRSQLARWQMKNCTPLWRKAHLEVKMYKTHHSRTTFGSWDVEKVHAVVARSTFRSQHVKNTRGSDHFWKLRSRKSARCCGVKHISKSKVQKTDGYGALLDVQMCFRVAGARDCAPCQNSAKRGGFCSISKNDGRRGTFEEDLQRCIFCGRRSTRDIFVGAVRRWGRWFPERGCILEHQIFRFAEMILRDRCSTSYDLASLFRGRRSTFDRWTGKIAKSIGTRLSARHSTFHFWRKSRRIALFWMLSSSKMMTEEVWQNCFVFDVDNFDKWGSLADLLRFWCCQVLKTQNFRTSHRIVLFSSLQIDR